MKTITVLVLFALVFASIAQDEGEFRQWMIKHNKRYADAAEYSQRYLNYVASTVRIQVLNSEPSTARFGHTKFSDLSPTEFKNTYLTAKFGKRENVTVLPRMVAAPQSFDWRSKNVVTPVKDQGQCGSCWAFSATENIESVWMLANNIVNPNMPGLSPQQIVDCDAKDDGCNGGDTITAYEYVIKSGGLERASVYPYTGEDGKCDFKQADVYAKISSYKYATNPNKPDESEMLDNLYAWAPLSICVDAAKWQNYVGGVFMSSQCGRDLDHCVQAVGYNLSANTPYWIVRNSWGEDWGEKGYIRLQYGKNTCGVADEATTAVVH